MFLSITITLFHLDKRLLQSICSEATVLSTLAVSHRIYLIENEVGLSVFNNISSQSGKLRIRI